MGNDLIVITNKKNPTLMQKDKREYEIFRDFFGCWNTCALRTYFLLRCEVKAFLSCLAPLVSRKWVWSWRKSLPLLFNLRFKISTLLRIDPSLPCSTFILCPAKYKILRIMKPSFEAVQNPWIDSPTIKIKQVEETLVACLHVAY